MGIGRLQPQYFQASGEATPQAQLPEQFVSNAPATSPIASHLAVGYENAHDFRRGPVVHRVERTIGMRTTYSRGQTRMPIRRLGADGQPYPWNSAANAQDQGPIRNCHFNDALYQAGYPGYNLGLSFKVPQLNTQSAETTRPQVSAPSMIDIARHTPLFRRNPGRSS